LELYESARAYDAAWQAAKAQFDANVARAAQARAGILPQAGLAAGVTRSSYENSTPPPAATDRSFTTQQASVNASQPLWRPANWATYRQGQRQAELAEFQL